MSRSRGRFTRSKARQGDSLRHQIVAPCPHSPPPPPHGIYIDRCTNHNYTKILKSDWLSTALVSPLIAQYASCRSHSTVRAITRELNWLYSRWLDTVSRAVNGTSRDGACFKLDKQTWQRKKRWTKKTISQNLLIKIL